MAKNKTTATIEIIVKDLRTHKCAFLDESAHDTYEYPKQIAQSEMRDLIKRIDRTRTTIDRFYSKSTWKNSREIVTEIFWHDKTNNIQYTYKYAE